MAIIPQIFLGFQKKKANKRRQMREKRIKGDTHELETDLMPTKNGVRPQKSYELINNLTVEEFNRRFDPGQMPALVIDALNQVGCDIEEFATLARSIHELSDEKASLLLFMKKGTLQCKFNRKN